MSFESRYEFLKLILHSFNQECDLAITNINQLRRQANESVEGMKVDGKTTDFAKYWQSFDDICDIIQKKTSLVRKFNIAQTESLTFSLMPLSSTAGTPTKSFDDLVSCFSEGRSADAEHEKNKLSQNDEESKVQNVPHPSENKNMLDKTAPKPDVIKNINSIIKGDKSTIHTNALSKKTLNEEQPLQVLYNNRVPKEEIKSSISQTSKSNEASEFVNTSSDSFDTQRSRNSVKSTSTDSNTYKPRSKIPDSPLAKLEIGNEIIVKVLDVLSPEEFHVSVGLPKEIEAAEAFLKKMNEFYLGFTGNPFMDKETAQRKLLNKICVVQHNDEWKRVRVIDWKMEPRMNDIVGVQFCDFGGTDYIRYIWLRELNPDYRSLPQQATQCYLYNLKPLQKNWPLTAIHMLKNITCCTAVVREVRRGAFGVELISESKNFNHSLVSKNFAGFKIVENDNSRDSSFDSYAVASEKRTLQVAPKQNNTPSNEHKKEKLGSQCRLSEEEIKALDDCIMTPEKTITDPNIAVMGHAPQDEKTACKFYNTPAGCFKKNCVKEHIFLNPDGWTRDQTPINNFALPRIVLPNPGTKLDVRVTHVSDVDKFYGTILRPFISRGMCGKYPLLYKSASELCQFLNSPEVSNNLKPLKYIPAPTELVIALYSVDDWWYRARIIDILENGYVAVEYVDYGNTAKVKDTDLREFTEEFTHLPFQAIKFVIGNVNVISDARKSPDAMDKISKVLLYKNVQCEILKVEDTAVSVSVQDSNGFDISAFLEALNVARVIPDNDAAKNFK